jgi:hypothetical protein
MLKKYKINTFKYFKTTYFNNHLIYFNMKKLFLFCAVLFAACASSLNVQAQTDFTATYLTNAGFDTAPICYTKAGGATLNSAVTRIGTLGYFYPIPGWTSACVPTSNAVQVATGEYGTTPTNAKGFNNVLPPLADKNGVTTGACLAMSAGWGDKAIYNQSVNMPAGRYALKLDVYNSFTVAAINVNYCGFVPTTGTATYSNRLTFPVATWVTDSISFYLTDQTAGVINLGFTTSAASSGAGAKVFVDNVTLIYYGIDKSGLKALTDSATVMKNNSQPVGTSTVYTDLNTAITNALVVYNNAGATAIDVVNQVTALNAAISNVYSAILLQSRITTWNTLPYNATSAIVNPSFESGLTGWTNTGGFGIQTNSSFSKMVGTNYVEKYVGTSTNSPGVLTGLKLSQSIPNVPNGIYLITLSAQAIQQANTTYPGGAFLFANNDSTQVFAINDYSVTTKVTNDTLNIGFKVNTSGNWVAVDNFRLSYISNGSPYVVLTPGSLFFDANNLTKPIAVSGGNLTSNLVLSAPAGITLDKTVLTPAQVAAGITVNATFDNATAITNGTISATTGSLTQNVTVNASADLTCFTPLYPSLTNIIPNPYLNDISGFGGWGHVSVVYGQAYCGAACVMMNALTNTYPDGAALDVSTVNWAPNSTYRLHAWVKTVDGTFAFLAKGTDPDVTISVAQSTDQWVLIDQTFTTGAAPTASFFTFNNVDGASTGKIAYIDNYELYNITSLVATSTENPADNQNQKVYIHENKIVVDFGLTESSNVEFSVYNPQGMLISSEKEVFAAGQNQKLINANLPSGVYMVKMSSNGLSFTTKVIK